MVLTPWDTPTASRITAAATPTRRLAITQTMTSVPLIVARPRRGQPDAQEHAQHEHDAPNHRASCMCPGLPPTIQALPGWRPDGQAAGGTHPAWPGARPWRDRARGAVPRLRHLEIPAVTAGTIPPRGVEPLAPGVDPHQRCADTHGADFAPQGQNSRGRRAHGLASHGIAAHRTLSGRPSPSTRISLSKHPPMQLIADPTMP